MTYSEKQWQIKYEIATNFYKEHGHLRIPARNYKVSYIDENNNEIILNIGGWLHNLRKRYKEGTISNERIEAMEKIGMEWDVYYSDWMSSYTKLIENSEGAKIKNVLEDKELRNWMKCQIVNYRNNHLNGERKELYEKSVPLFYITNLSWEYNYFLATIFYEEKGHLNIPNDYVVQNMLLGQWIDTQRGKYRIGKLSSEKIEKLNKIGMIWNLSEYNFYHNKITIYNRKKYYKKIREKCYEFLEQFKESNFESEKDVKTLNKEFSKIL